METPFRLIKLFDRARTHGTAIALKDGNQTLSYDQLLMHSKTIALSLLGRLQDCEEERIAFFMPGSFAYASTMLGIWRAGGIALPLNIESVRNELEYVLTNAGVTRVVATKEMSTKIQPLCKDLGIELLLFEQLVAVKSTNQLPVLDTQRRAMILYTSGTTNKPKGVVSTHAAIEAQITALVEAWGWRSSDSIPLFLPLHHVHGIINILLCALWAGGRVDFCGKFNIKTILSGVSSNQYTVFMAVPTVYIKIIEHLNAADIKTRTLYCDGFKKMRLMVSGSAALPVTVHKQWEQLTGQILLERYGMTEIGMAISNPLVGERIPGTIGKALPGVEVCLVNESGKKISLENKLGEIWVKGPSVFREYWANPKTTRESFSGDWFKTGDMAILDGGYYRILGRMSVDIIKSGGYKISALEIEDALLNHKAIVECAVIALSDSTWGEAVAAVVVLKDGTSLNLSDLRHWASSRLSNYKIPKHFKSVKALPRNAMGKVTKKEVKVLFD